MILFGTIMKMTSCQPAEMEKYSAYAVSQMGKKAVCKIDAVELLFASMIK